MTTQTQQVLEIQTIQVETQSQGMESNLSRRCVTPQASCMTQPYLMLKLIIWETLDKIMGWSISPVGANIGV